eukprot:CAMPEP_0197176544 /NCGR_PEP_ID=MMETSP1423-20130617/2426_1 /TAXON_ID=476441 /ORGANISM="Pseudo-nitzschia heimii, Strain UNC1101" /LENGTH=715 /DNA_ID=CAMNT_0042625925 /DNA_START=180 /DNA_END=2327 /DNA_ORIENTATION=+
MELKAYINFKRQLADIQVSTALSPDSCILQTKQIDDIRRNEINRKRSSTLFEEVSGIDKNINIISNSDHSSRKRMKKADRLLFPFNENSCDNSVISSSNSSINTNTNNNGDGDDADQAINNNVPFASNSWWKKGNEQQIRDIISNTGDMNSGYGNNQNNNRNSMKRKSQESITNTSNPETTAHSSFNSMVANYAGSRMIGNSVPTPATVSSGAPVLPSATSRDQRSSSLLRLLGEVTSSGGNQENDVRHPQHQLLQQRQELQALRMQQNGAAMTNCPTNTQEFNRNPFLGFQTQVPYPSSMNNNSISRIAMQSHLQLRNNLDPSLSPSEGMDLSSMQLQQHQQLHHQQRQQQNFQSLFPLGYPQANSPFFSTQNAFLQQRHNIQRQQMQRPEVARGEMRIDASRAPGDIGDTARLPAMERELEESYLQDASFDELGHSGGNRNEQQKTSVTDNKQKDSLEIMDVNDFVFSDTVPLMATSGSPSLKVAGFDSDVDVDDIDVAAIVDANGSIDDKLVRHQSISSHASNNNPSKSNSYATSSSKLKEVKFRAYQAENWTEKFEELLRFREENGHCLVPNCHPENPALAQWTKRQRYQYKLKQDGKRSTITDERVQALEEAGFVWDSHKAVWAERLEELKEFKKVYKHCNVPSRYKPNHQLAIWVKRQRRQWKNKLDRLPNCMTDERQRALEAIGFVWDMKKGKKSPASSPTKQRGVDK